MTPSSTYRLQVNHTFDLHQAADVCDYLATLGVGDVYLSPLLPSSKGSDHGYDVIAFDRIDPQRGGGDGWTRLLAAARSRRLGVVVDIVPNHTGVAIPAENAAWWDVLKFGRSSAYASWFDIEWARGRILLPVLGDDFSPSQLEIVESSEQPELCYFEHRFPIAPGTLGGTPAEVHDRQAYELVGFRRADAEQNYRRFFAVTSLAGLRVEDPAVFEATHAAITRWVRDDGIDGLRVDHPDGLVDPVGYVQRLRDLLGTDRWLVIEKILEPGEALPEDWPVDGTTGYDALAEVGPLFVDASTEAEFDSLYRSLVGDELDFHEHVAVGKRNAVTTILRAEVERLARLVPNTAGASAALAELLVAFPVYRSYLPTGSEYLAEAIATVRTTRPDLDAAIGTLVPRLSDPADELCARFQQTSGAVMAKGVEDTAYYRYTRFVALNEVGGDPSRFGVEPDAFHEAQSLRQLVAPQSMTTLSTHDTKRGEDVRARLAVLSEFPAEWSTLVRGLMSAAPLPDASFAYLLWQTFVGVGFIERDRMHAYAEKAMREAAVSTTWVDPDEAFEAAVHRVVDAAYDDPAVRDPLAEFIALITPYGWSNALSQKLIQLTQPGAPDVYQGSELWDDSLVIRTTGDLSTTRRAVRCSTRWTVSTIRRRSMWTGARNCGWSREHCGCGAAGPSCSAGTRRCSPTGRPRTIASRSTAVASSPWRPGCLPGCGAAAAGTTRRSTWAARRPTRSRAAGTSAAWRWPICFPTIPWRSSSADALGPSAVSGRPVCPAQSAGVPRAGLLAGSNHSPARGKRVGRLDDPVALGAALARPVGEGVPQSLGQTPHVVQVGAPPAHDLEAGPVEQGVSLEPVPGGVLGVLAQFDLAVDLADDPEPIPVEVHAGDHDPVPIEDERLKGRSGYPVRDQPHSADRLEWRLRTSVEQRDRRRGPAEPRPVLATHPGGQDAVEIREPSMQRSIAYHDCLLDTDLSCDVRNGASRAKSRHLPAQQFVRQHRRPMQMRVPCVAGVFRRDRGARLYRNRPERKSGQSGR